MLMAVTLAGSHRNGRAAADARRANGRCVIAWEPDWYQMHPAVPNHGIRVGIQFTSEEFRGVADRAEQAGMTAPAFLKALEQVSADTARTG